MPSKPVLTKQLFQRGEKLYQKQCAACHGPQGAADGKAAYLLYPKPRDFTRDKFRLISTTTMTATDEDLFKTITRGMPGSAMPPWEHLSESDRWALVYYVRYLSEKGTHEEKIERIVNKKIDPSTFVNVPVEPPVTQEALKRGQEIFLASCAGCHGPQGKGDGKQEMKDNLGYPVRPRDLTAGIFKGAGTSDELYKRMVAGIPGSPMPSYTGTFTEEQIWQLIHFTQSLAKGVNQERARLKSTQIAARKISGEIETNPFAGQWAAVKPVFIALTPLWWRDERIEGVDVKVLHNGEKIAFYLKWADPEPDDNIVKVQSFSDGAALQFSTEQDPPFFGMGDGQSPVYIWHWKSAWEKRGDKREDIETEYPHTGIDLYPSQKDYQPGDRAGSEKSKIKFHDPNFITGWGAGNPVSNPGKEESVEEAAAGGLGSYTTQMPKIEKVDVRGVWVNGSWHVIFVRSLKSSEKGSLQFRPGEKASAAFALWDGSKKDRNGQKMVSIWNELILEK